MDSSVSPQEHPTDAELLAAAAGVLGKLRFTPEMPRDAKWRTTDQLARELGLDPADVARLDRVLCEHEALVLERLKQGRPAEAVIRRAKYPDRTTALPLWGSTALHGPPWTGQQPERTDPPEDISPSLRTAQGAPSVFLSHTHHDAALALRVAERLAALGIGCWRFETHIDRGGGIADGVREAIATADGVVALVTRHSIASLWVLTELHSGLSAGRSVALVVDADDPDLLDLLQSAEFHHPDQLFDLTVTCDPGVLDRLHRDYARRESVTRAERYPTQARDFLASLPYYLGSGPPGTGGRPWQSMLCFPRPPAVWSGAMQFGPLEEFVKRIAHPPAAGDIPGTP